MADTHFKSSKILSRLILSVVNASRTVLISLSGLVINYLLLHFKSPVLLDAYVYWLTVVGLLLVFNNWGSRDYLIKTMSEPVTSPAGLVSNSLLARLILFLILSPLVLLLPVDLTTRLAILFLLLLKSCGSVFEALITVRKKYTAFLFGEVFFNLIFILLLLFDGNTNSPVILFYEILAVESGRVLFSLWHFRNELRLAPGLKKAIGVIKQSSRFFFVALAGFSASRADLYVLSFFLPSAELSRYYILLNLVILCQVVFTSLNNTFAANILRYNTSSFKKFKIYTLKTGIAFALLGSSFIYILSLLYYKQFLDLPITLLIIINLFAYSSTFISVYNFTRLNKQNVISKVIITAGTLNLLSSLLLVKLFGFYGAFASNTICAVFTALYFQYISTRLSKNQVVK